MDDTTTSASMRALYVRMSYGGHRLAGSESGTEEVGAAVPHSIAIASSSASTARPTLESLEKLDVAVGAELVVGVGENLSDNRSTAKLVRDGYAVIRRAS